MTRSARGARLVRTLGAAFALLSIACARAQTPQSADPVGGRLVRIFDFEERDTNPGDVPRYWFRRQDSGESARPAFPSWNRAGLSYTIEGGAAHRGQGSVVLPTSGGSTSLVLGKDVLPVFPQSDYAVVVTVRTDGLTHARAGLIARMLDQEGRPIPGAQSVSELVQTRGQWQRIGVDITSDAPGCAYIQVELVLLQPREAWGVRGVREPAFAIHKQDRAGRAWFDDVTVLQLPRVDLSTQAPGNVVIAPQRPRVLSRVRDLAGQRLVESISIVDGQGREVSSRRRAIDADAREETWEPELPAYGWYRALLTLSDESGRSVGGTTLDMVWIAPPGAMSAGERSRFGLILSDLSAPEERDIADIATTLGAGWVTLPAWSRTLTPESARPRAEVLQGIVSELMSEGCGAIIALGPVPEAVTSLGKFDAGDSWSVLLEGGAPWLPLSEPILDRLGPRVSAWQVGRVRDDRAFWRSWPGELRAIERAISPHVPGATLCIPTMLHHDWNVSQLRSVGVPVALCSRVPSGESAPSLRLAEASWKPLLNATGDRLGVQWVLEPLSGVTPQASGEHLARQLIESWRLLGDSRDGVSPRLSFALHDPWTLRPGKRPQLRPGAALAAWASVSQRLADRRIIGEFPAAEGVRCSILAPSDTAESSRRGALILWNESAPPERAIFEGAVGRGPLTLCDVFGNERPLEQTHTRAGASVVRVALTDAPMFIEGVDVPLVLFLSRIRIEEAYLQAGADILEREIILNNPWPATITGRVIVAEPGGFGGGQKDRTWRITPRSSQFAIASGQSERLPITIACSPTEPAGFKAFLLSIDVTAEEPYGLVETTRYVELGLKEYSVDVRATSRGGDVGADVVLTNTSDRMLTLEITCLAPGMPRAKATVSNLAPGRQVVRRFSWEGAADKLRGQPVTASVAELERNLRLNKVAVVP